MGKRAVMNSNTQSIRTLAALRLFGSYIKLKCVCVHK